MYTIINIIYKIELVIEILLTIRFILSWLPNINSPLVDIVYSLTEPLLRPFRSILNLGNLSIDFSPLILILIIRLLQTVLFKILFLI